MLRRTIPTVEESRALPTLRRWRDAMAAKPSTWRLMGVACGPREVDPNIHSAEEWCAWARGPNRERLEGRGSGPQDALLALTVELKKLVG